MRAPAAPTAIAGCALLLAACLAAPPPAAPAPANEPVQLSLEERMQLQREVHEPRAEHRRLDAFAGEWEVVVRVFPRPGADPRVAGSGRARIDWTMGGRFQRWEISLELAGQERAHRVSGVMGYDLSRSQYQAVWFSELDTALSLATGTGNPEGRGLLWAAAAVAPGEAAAVLGGRSVLRRVARDHFVIEALATDGLGSEWVRTRTDYTRRRDGPTAPEEGAE